MAGIVCDSREGDVFTHLQDEDIPVSRETLEFGDFLIKLGDDPKVLLERKTWADLSGSISDGRVDEQIEGLVSKRDTLGIRVGFILEGIAFPNPKTKLRKTPYGNLQAKMRHMYLRHNVPYFQTKDHAGTTLFLVQMARDIEKINGVLPSTRDGSVSAGSLGGRRTVPVSTKLRDMWGTLPSVSKANAHVIGGNVSLREFMTTSEDVIAEYKYPSGRKIGDKKAAEIVKGKTNTVLVLSKIPKISSKKAEIIASHYTLEEVVNMDQDQLMAMGKEHGLKIGKVTAKTIHEFINMKIVS